MTPPLSHAIRVVGGRQLATSEPEYHFVSIINTNESKFIIIVTAIQL